MRRIRRSLFVCAVAACVSATGCNTADTFIAGRDPTARGQIHATTGVAGAGKGRPADRPRPTAPARVPDAPVLPPPDMWAAGAPDPAQSPAAAGPHGDESPRINEPAQADPLPTVPYVRTEPPAPVLPPVAPVGSAPVLPAPPPAAPQSRRPLPVQEWVAVPSALPAPESRAPVVIEEPRWVVPEAPRGK